MSETVQRWEASYYHGATRRWVYGVLSLTPSYVYFQSNNINDTPGSQVEIEFSSVKCVKKALSSFMFGAIIFTTNDNSMHWFSSLADKNKTFLTIQHFYRSHLLNPSQECSRHDLQKESNNQTRTKLGTEILQSVHNSQKTLEKAAVSLHHQGHQLSSAACTVQDIHQDLSVAERIVSGLSSWLGRWRVPKVYRNEEILVIGANDIGDVTDVEALFTHAKGNKCSQPKECVLRIGTDGVTILDLKQKILHCLRWFEVSRVRVISPWEILVSRFEIGHPDEGFSITCVKMAALLPDMERHAHSKIEYMEPGDRFSTAVDGHAKRGQPDWSHIPSTSGKQCDTQHSSEADSSTPPHHPSQTHTFPVSEAEAAQLSSALAQIKSLALDVNIEQDSQLEKLDQLADDVDRAGVKQKVLNSRVKAMLK